MQSKPNRLPGLGGEDGADLAGPARGRLPPPLSPRFSISAQARGGWTLNSAGYLLGPGGCARPNLLPSQGPPGAWDPVRSVPALISRPVLRLLRRSAGAWVL